MWNHCFSSACDQTILCSTQGLAPWRHHSTHRVRARERDTTLLGRLQFVMQLCNWHVSSARHFGPTVTSSAIVFLQFASFLLVISNQVLKPSYNFRVFNKACYFEKKHLWTEWGQFYRSSVLMLAFIHANGINLTWCDIHRGIYLFKSF